MHTKSIPYYNYMWVLAKKVYKSFVCRFVSFHPLSEKWGEFSNISAVRCSHRLRPSLYFNYKKFRWSLKIMKIGLWPWCSLTTPWKKLVKFGTSFDDRSFQTGASHMKDHGFSKGDVSIQTHVVGDFIVWPHKNFHGTQSLLYHGFDFLAHFRYR